MKASATGVASGEIPPVASALSAGCLASADLRSKPSRFVEPADLQEFGQRPLNIGRLTLVLGCADSVQCEVSVWMLSRRFAVKLSTLRTGLYPKIHL